MFAPPCSLRLLAGCALMLALPTARAAKPIALQGSPGIVSGRAPAPAEQPMAELDEFHAGEPQFDTSLVPLPPNVPGLSFETTATSEFGDLVRLADTAHYIDSVTVTMSSWALRSHYAGAAPYGFTHPVTLTLYAVDRSMGFPRPGAKLGAHTQAFLIPWRPEPDPKSTSPLRPWRAANGNYYPGVAFNLTFDLGAQSLALPDEIIFGISFNTQHHGPAPIGVAGPYDALHVGVTDLPPASGADVEPDAVFWKTNIASHYGDAGATGVHVFRRDTGWTPFRPIVRFNNSAYGALSSVSSRLSVTPAATSATAAALDGAEQLVGWALARTLWDGNNRLQPGHGALVFDLLAEAAGELRRVSVSDTRAVAPAQAALASLVRVAESLAEVALADTLIAGADPRRFTQAHDALDEAATHLSRARFDQAIDEYGNAWRQAEVR